MEGSALIVSIIGIFITVVIEALYFAYKMGVIAKSISVLEEKQDKHNNLIERMVINEQKISAIEDQLTNNKDKIKNLENVQHECFRNRH
jgi:hypothetical protein